MAEVVDDGVEVAVEVVLDVASYLQVDHQRMAVVDVEVVHDVEVAVVDGIVVVVVVVVVVADQQKSPHCDKC